MKIAYVYFRHHHRNTKIQMTRIMNNIILQNHPRCRRAMTIILLNVVPNSVPVLEKTSFFHSLVSTRLKSATHTSEFISIVDSRTSLPMPVEIYRIVSHNLFHLRYIHPLKA